MGATNQTTNYELPLFIGTDKPSWLGDFNGAMNKIDTSIKGNKDEIDSLKTRMTATESVANSASSTASTALTNANNAQSTANTAQTTANTANTKAEGAQSTANTALSNATTAQNTADTANSTAQSALTLSNSNSTEISKLNLENFNAISTSNINTNYGSVTSNSLTVATNSDGSVGKIYGTLRITNSGASNNLVVSFPSSLRPSSPITINGVLNRINYIQAGINDISQITFDVATNGTITITTPNTTAITEARFQFFACLLFLKDFGDEPVE